MFLIFTAPTALGIRFWLNKFNKKILKKYFSGKFIADRTYVMFELMVPLSSVVSPSVTDVLWLNGARGPRLL